MEQATYKDCLNKLRNNPDDWMDRNNCHIVPEYFGKVNWADPANWRGFLENNRMFDSFNGGAVWMKSFWQIFAFHRLFESSEFLTEYLKRCDENSSVSRFVPSFPAELTM